MDILSENIKQLCKLRKRQLKNPASDMEIDPASLNRAMYGNARLNTIQKMASALGVSIRTLFEPLDDDEVEGYIKMRGKIYQFNSREELYKILRK